MDVQRCPECGGRITTNYCDICMKKVPFRGAIMRKMKDPWDYSSAHRQESGHTCVSFDTEPPKAKPVKTVTFPQKKPAGAKNATKAKAIAIVVAVLSLIPTLFAFVEEITEASPEPEYNYEAYVEADVPQIIPKELYNDGEIQITAGSAGKYYDDYAVSIMIQNDSDRDVWVDSREMAVNGYMVGGGINTQVDAGESQQAFLQLHSYELEQAGIRQVADIVFNLSIYESESYEAIASVDHLTLETDIADGFVQPIDDAGWEMYTDENLRMVYQGAEVYEYGDCDLWFYLENLSDENVWVSTSAIRINGQEVSGFLWDTLFPKTRAIDCIYLYDLDEMDITQLSQITEVSIELMIEVCRGDDVINTVQSEIRFNPNDLPVSE